MTEKISPSLTGIPETLLIPLYQRAQEAQRPDAMLKDDKAVEIVNQLKFTPANYKLQQHDEVALVLRVRPYYFIYTIPFLRKSTGIFHYRLG